MMKEYDPSYGNHYSLADVFEEGGYVYLAMRWDGLFKIGVAIDPHNRMMSLRNKHGRVELIYARWHRDPLKLESLLHKQYRKQRKAKEIFHLSLTDIHNVIEEMDTWLVRDALPIALLSFDARGKKLTALRYTDHIVIASYMHGDIGTQYISEDIPVDSIPDVIQFKMRKINGTPVIIPPLAQENS